ncbi:hypothetical protein CYG48_04890 [Neorhizobium sp. SOG26]|nr:hypothetical protein CYG48_04890 [Neorhizobium sp. SOG26]
MTTTREPFGRSWLQGLDDEFDRQFPASATPLTTQDGTVIVSDSNGNSASGRTLQEAQEAYDRRQA